MDICLFGLPKSGKTSIIKVIFQKTSPQQTIIMETTQRLEQTPYTMGNLFNFNLCDFSGNFDPNDANPPELNLIENCGAFIFVLDVQNDDKEFFTEALDYFLKTVEFAQKQNNKLNYHVFVHKVDSEKYAVDEKRTEVLNKIKDMVNETIDNHNVKLSNIEYHLTSIYDHSLFECFSKVVQKVVKQVPFVTNLLDAFITSCKMEKAFLFDIISKLYIATDSAPVEMPSFAICSEMIDVFIDISYIYGQQKKNLKDYDSKSQAIIKLNDKTILYLKEVQKYIALICIIKENNYDRVFLIDYNIDVFKKVSLTPDDPLAIYINNGVQNVKLRASTIGEKIKWANALKNRQSEILEIPEDEGREMRISDSLAEMWVIHAKVEELADNLAEMMQHETDKSVIGIVEDIVKYISSLKRILTNCTSQIKYDKKELINLRKSILPKAVASRQKSRENQSFIEEEYNQSQSNNESDTFFDFDNPSTYENEYNLNDKQNKVEKDALNNLLERLERNQPEKCEYLKKTKLLSLLELNTNKSNESLFENKPEKISFPAILKDLDINNFTPPIYLMEPYSFLQHLASSFFSFYLLDLASTYSDPCWRLAYVMSFFLSSFSNLNEFLFPFSSLIGETYFFENSSFSFFGEQLTENKCSFCCWNMNFDVWCTINFSKRIWGKYLEIEPNLLMHVKIKKFNEMILVSSIFRILITQNEIDFNLKALPKGEVSFISCESKDFGLIKFLDMSALTESFVFNSLKQKRFEINGSPLDTLSIVDCISGKKSQIWRKKDVLKLPLNLLNLGNIESLKLTDSRFRIDIRALEKGRLKMSLEETSQTKNKKKMVEKGESDFLFEEIADTISKKKKFVLKKDWQKDFGFNFLLN